MDWIIHITICMNYTDLPICISHTDCQPICLIRIPNLYSRKCKNKKRKEPISLRAVEEDDHDVDRWGTKARNHIYDVEEVEEEEEDWTVRVRKRDGERVLF